MHIADIPEIASLTTPEKILLIEELWDDISADASCIPVPECHKQELDKRWECHRKEPGALLTVEELQQRIEQRK
ncbi:MAG: addiction module protein [Candidatus Hydrogenedentes bacterium]|jgi:putative addiction module component (TIGR02574 family)|nr:addiction module protein [Candidatus Hydrogenedentota bacterium]